MFKAELLSYYRDGHQIFSGISFDINYGTCMFIKGQNGSGKTTLLRLLAGLLPMQEGAITYDGTSISNNHDLIAQHIDYVGHVNATKNQMTAWDNLKFWHSLCEPDKRIDLSTNFEDPMLINDFKNKPISFCSAGQIRRVALSRLTISKKKLWLLDEPTASLDETAIRNLGKMLEKHCLEGGAAIIADHKIVSMSMIDSKSIEMKQSKRKLQGIHSDPFLDGDW